MKSFYLLCLSLFLTTALSAQYQKGNWYLEGSSSLLLDLPSDDQRRSSFEAQAFRAGYFVSDRLLVGSRVEMFGSGGNDFSDSSFGVELRPFARYYFPGGDKRKISYFGEVGFGTISAFSGNGSFETDFHFGGGLEKTLLPGVVGTALLRYDANASGLNITNFTFGFNLLLGQLEKSDRGPMLTAGTFTTKGSFGGLLYGREGLSGPSSIIGSAFLNPSIGYFLADGLMAEAQVAVSYLRLDNLQDFGLGVTETRTNNILNTSVELNLRYYLIKSGKFLPYVTAGGGYQTFRNRRNDSASGERTTTTDNLFYQAGAGASWFLSPNVALDGTLRYRSESFEGNNLGGTVEQNAVQLDVGFRFFLNK
jgi:opacity protein-like surface antigen